MKGVFWNSDGFKDPKKYKFISDLTKENGLNFIAISETGRSEFTPRFLKNLCAGREYLWHCKAPIGRSGGMLMGVDLQTFDIGAIEEGDYYIKFHLCNKTDEFKWALVMVYGPAQAENKEQFLAELVRMCSHENLPLLMGGDYNILRHPSEKNNDRYNARWPFLFNAVIDSLNLRELEMSGRKYTWANNLATPTFEKLDRVLMTTEWEEKFPLTTVRALTRGLSDHTPLLLNSGEPSSTGTRPLFKFEIGWLLREGFIELIREIWSNTVVGQTPMERWQGKIRRVRQYLRGWAKNTSGQYKKEKKEILNTLDGLNKKEENISLHPDEINLKQFLNNRLAELLREEEIKWYQRAKVKELLEGDSNTKYFQLIASGKHRKTRIFQLQDKEMIIEGDTALQKYITKYYKDLFSAPVSNSFSLDESRANDIKQVSEEENNMLIRPFSEEEIREAVFQMEHNKAPGPDGFPAEFYQACWDILKEDLMALYTDFHKGKLPLYSLNFGTVILLPKCKEATKIQQYRPICLLNVSFKIFTKVATNRVTHIAQKVISPSQTAFLPGRNIMEGVIVLHETIHEMHRKKQSGVILKIDFEKAYDKID
jgi:exonuclease III